MCKLLSAQAFTGDGQPHPDCPDPIEFDGDAAFERHGYCTCWIDDPAGAGVLQDFVEQCVRPLLANVSWGEIRVYVH